MERNATFTPSDNALSISRTPLVNCGQFGEHPRVKRSLGNLVGISVGFTIAKSQTSLFIEIKVPLGGTGILLIHVLF